MDTNIASEKDEKLIERTVSIVKNITGADDKFARKILAECGCSAKTAIVMIMCHMTGEQAEDALKKVEGHI